MFGPDKCGNDYKLHFIFRYKHPITGTLVVSICSVLVLYICFNVFVSYVSYVLYLMCLRQVC